MSSDHETVGGGGPDFRYWAFISYSQRDVKWALWLHRELETYRLPRALVGRPIGQTKVPRRLLPVFRDRDELPSAGDLRGKIRESLEASRALIVICSPYGAASPWVNEEVRSFKVLGRADRIFPLIVDGEPYASERPELGLPECFPPALRFAVAADGSVTNQRSDPLAADARDDKDGRADASLKVIAGILGIGFDDLRQREQIRQRRRRLIGLGASFAAGVLLAMTYIGLADGDFNVPGGANIRRLLDRYELSVLRPVAPHEAVVRATVDARQQLRTRLLAEIGKGKLNFKLDTTASVWTLAQVAAALYRDPDAAEDELRPLGPLIDRVFQEDFVLTDSNGDPVGWPGDGPLPRAETALWMIIAMSHALQRKESAVEAMRPTYLHRLETVQRIAENYYPLRDGGWNVVRESKFEEHNYYTSALALYALLELDEAHLCWRGSCERLTQMIRETTQWLLSNFVDEKRLTGWRRTFDDNGAPDPELSLMVYGAIVRAPVTLPDNVRIAALAQLTDLRLRPYYPAAHDIRHWVVYTNDRGRLDSISIPTMVLWYPWAAETLVHWQRYAEAKGFPPEIKVALARSLSHVILDGIEDMTDDMAHVPLYTLGETAYGISGVR
jgi:TIR domain-containing protein